MKEDILEKMVDEYLQHKGYFTRHNIKFRPAGDHVEYDTRQDAARACVRSGDPCVGCDMRPNHSQATPEGHGAVD